MTPASPARRRAGKAAHGGRNHARAPAAPSASYSGAPAAAGPTTGAGAAGHAAAGGGTAGPKRKRSAAEQTTASGAKKRDRRMIESRARCAHEVAARAKTPMQDVRGGHAMQLAEQHADQTCVWLCPGTTALNFASSACAATIDGCFAPGACPGCGRPRIAWPFCTECLQVHHPCLLAGDSRSCRMKNIRDRRTKRRQAAERHGRCCRAEMEQSTSEQQAFKERWKAQMWVHNRQRALAPVKCKCGACAARRSAHSGGAAALMMLSSLSAAAAVNPSPSPSPGAAAGVAQAGTACAAATVATAACVSTPMQQRPPSQIYMAAALSPVPPAASAAASSAAPVSLSAPPRISAPGSATAAAPRAMAL
eukprot:g4607.t1